MDFAEQLRILEAAQGDPAKLALATVDLAHPALPAAERAGLRAALQAAAVPHWCDEAILGALLGIPPADAAARLARLRGLTVVEEFKARGLGAVNVHEAARLALRRALAAGEPDRFRALSARAAALFAADALPAGRIEWIYHRLGAEPEAGATELTELNRVWSGSARPEAQAALAVAMQELEEAQLVAGRARAWVLLTVGWNRSSRGEAAQLGATASEALALARQTNDAEAESDALCLLGDMLTEQEKFREAQAAYGESLAISQRLAQLDPGNAGWQRELAAAHSRVGDVLVAQDKLGEAQEAFSEDLAISRRLAVLDPGNAGWQRDLAVAHSRVGEVLEARDKLEEAQAAFGEALTINRRLVALDPTNAGWQRELAVALAWQARLSERAGNLNDARPPAEQALQIRERLTALDPTNALWQQDLETSRAQVARLRGAGSPPVAGGRT